MTYTKLFILISSLILLCSCNGNTADNEKDSPDIANYGDAVVSELPNDDTSEIAVTEDASDMQNPESVESEENIESEESKAEQDSDAEQSTESDDTDTSQAADAQVNTVSTLEMTNNYLEPFDDYSWEMTEKPEYVVLHFSSAVVTARDEPYKVENVRKIFEDVQLSIHYIIDREGNIQCWLPETRAAWHAGKGEYNGIEKLTNSMNKYSIGIEIFAIGSENDMKQYLTHEEYNSLDKSLLGYTDAQYESLVKLVKDICDRNGIPFDKEHIIGHDEYNPLKSDPGELFDWTRLFGS